MGHRCLLFLILALLNGVSARANAVFSFDGTSEKLLAVGDDLLVVTPFLAGNVRALERVSGKLLWSHETEGGANAILSVRRNEVIYADGGGRIRIVDARSGAIRREKQFPGKIRGDLTFSDSTLFVPLSGTPSALVALDSETLQTRWSFADGADPDGSFSAPPVVDGDDVFVASDTGRLYGLARRSGKKLSSRSLAPRRKFRSISGNVPAIAVVGKRLVVFVADDEAPSRAVVLKRDGLSVEGELPLRKSYHGRLEVYDDRVFIWDDGGPQHSAGLTLFDPVRRQVLWRFDSGKGATVASTLSIPPGLFSLWGCGHTIHEVLTGKILERSQAECPTTMTSNPVRVAGAIYYVRSDPKEKKSEMWTIPIEEKKK